MNTIYNIYNTIYREDKRWDFTENLPHVHFTCNAKQVRIITFIAVSSRSITALCLRFLKRFTQTKWKKIYFTSVFFRERIVDWFDLSRRCFFLPSSSSYRTEEANCPTKWKGILQNHASSKTERTKHIIWKLTGGKLSYKSSLLPDVLAPAASWLSLGLERLPNGFYED